jgi:hypothetical protein
MYLNNTQRIVAFPLQQCLVEDSPVLRSKYIACLDKNEYAFGNILRQFI